jgi:hypothetical protein
MKIEHAVAGSGAAACLLTDGTASAFCAAASSALPSPAFFDARGRFAPAHTETDSYVGALRVHQDSSITCGAAQ